MDRPVAPVVAQAEFRPRPGTSEVRNRRRVLAPAVVRAADLPAVGQEAAHRLQDRRLQDHRAAAGRAVFLGHRAASAAGRAACPVHHDGWAAGLPGAADPKAAGRWGAAASGVRSGAGPRAADRMENLMVAGPRDACREAGRRVAWDQDLRNDRPAGCRRGNSRTGLQCLRQALVVCRPD